VAPALLAHFSTFGIPQQLVTAQGREYCNELEKLLWTALKIRHTQLATRHIAHPNNQHTRTEYTDKYNTAKKVVYPRYVAGEGHGQEPAIAKPQTGTTMGEGDHHPERRHGNQIQGQAS
jgi:hypothetical protein